MTPRLMKRRSIEADASPLLVGRLGYYIPFSILAGATTAIACGFITTWNAGTTTADWIGHQILFGLRGMGLQMVRVSVQLPSHQGPIVIRSEVGHSC